MSYAAYKMMHWPTSIDHCAAGFITHSPADAAAFSSAAPAAAASGPDGDIDSAAASAPRRVGPTPNLVVSAANVLEVYAVRADSATGAEDVGNSSSTGAILDGISGARLELVCHYRLHGNIESMAVLSDGTENRRDSIAVTFKDAKIACMEFDDSTNGLRTSSMHCFEGPEWFHLKRGRESFAWGPIIKADPQGRCGAVLVYGLQMIILKAAEVGQSLVGEDEPTRMLSSTAVRIESSYVIDLRDLEMNHIKDFTFVHGYIEPVLVILHEREPTWAGRISSKSQTCMLSAFSISMGLKQHPMIWSAAKLPHDAYQLLAVPPPISGILVICANSIHYHSQSTSCSLALNSFSSQPDGSPEILKTSFHVELDVAKATWLSHDIVMFSSKNGEILLLTVVYDGRAVQRLDLMKSKASVLSSGATTLGSSFFFLGSRLADSLLVQFSCGVPTSVLPDLTDESADIEGDLPFSKRLKRIPSDVLQDVTSVEELSFHNKTVPNIVDSAQKISFVVRDALINVGPLKDFAYGLRTNSDPNATGIAKQSNYELVCCSGHGKNGTLSALQQSIRPDLITEVELPSCTGIWTVYYKSSRGNTADNNEYHAYLIISLESRTMVLQTGDDLGEVTETVDYNVQASTIAAGNLFGRRRVIQVYAKGARVLDGSFMTQELNFSMHTSESSLSSEPLAAASASIADPYVLLKMGDGSIRLLIGDHSTCTISINAPAICASSSERISSCTLYCDRGPEPWLRKTRTDAWISTGIGEVTDVNDNSSHDLSDIYCIICYESGKLEIFEVPSFKCVFSVDNFVSGPSILFDAFSHISTKGSGIGDRDATKVSVKKEEATSIKIVELAMHRWSGQFSRPFLFGLLNDGTLLCYHAYYYESSESNVQCAPSSPHGLPDIGNATDSRLRNLRFRRVSIDISSRDDISCLVRPRITIFNNVGGYEGLFLGGPRPTWIFVCRQRFRVHPQLCDGPIVAFTVLHNVNCCRGLIYVTSQGFLKICQLPSAYNYDNYWPVQKVPLHGTPHQVTYYAEQSLYPLIVSVPVRPLNQVLSSMADQELGLHIENDVTSGDDLQKVYTVDEFEVRIMELGKPSGHWETRFTIPMQSFENALTVRIVTLQNTSTKENETLMAIGTAYVQGEDVAARGRVLLYSFSRSENSQNLVTEVYSKESKGAVSAVASLQGHLLIASGPKITLNKWTGSELTAVAFYDAPLHVVSLNIVKNFVLFGDIHKSIYFLSWKEQGSQLNLLAKDFGSLDCFATEFLIDGSTLSLVVSDSDKNVQIFYYAPKMVESWKGQKLLSRAEFHVGAHVSKFLRLQMLPTQGLASEKTNRFALVFGTLDGGIGCIAPVDELTFRRLQSLQRKLVDAVPHVCGLNPRSFRHFKSNGKAHRPGPDNIIDFELLSHYEMLSLEEQLEIAQQIGTTRSQILSNFSDFLLGTSFL
ncbi:probable cleavage and polyadenylation specificity factor subunit 1 isoform X3 [Sorghum bicolor]|uniref:probable cleavage and polyadenylation specificity factor subunit 1 isoform X3 n=1 Tax=Sorghum bicolor TaxID=4558 RepID=UPI0003E5FE05|nr:probable cleavage and polyadenylation specificity factor subunit 1 isoform X3 [Sorghum bicolor]|eukprot:XP_021317957.1 probable cleavage and polyadenylation specificity factor subunit 1 isoform X3 [Sorghum bicolor]